MTEYSLTKIKQKTKNYPYPIVGIINKYYKLNSSKVNDRHALLGDMFESIVKFIAIAVLNEALVYNKKNVKKFFPEGLAFLKHPSLGHWLSIIRKLASERVEDNKTLNFSVYEWWNGEKLPSDLRKLYQELPEISFSGNSGVSGVMNSLVTYRNKVWKGHGAGVLSDKECENRIPVLENLIGYILDKAEYLGQLVIFYTELVKKSGNEFEASSVSLNGIGLESVTFKYNNFDENEIYLAYENQSQLKTRPILLSPFVFWKDNFKGIKQFYFINDVKRSYIEYLSYIDSSFYNHKEVSKQLEDTFGGNVIDSIASDDYEKNIYLMSEEERIEFYQSFVHLGTEQMEKGQIDSALIHFERALEYHRTAEVIIKMCKCMFELKDPKEYILNTLNYAFEIDPDSIEANRLKTTIENTNEDFWLKEGEKLNLKDGNFTIYDLFIPARFRGLSMIIYIAGVILFYLSSAALLIFLEPDNLIVNIGSPLLIMFQTLIMIVGNYVTKHSFLDSYYGLYVQLDNMRKDRFDKWFVIQYYKLFGFINKEKNETNSDSSDSEHISARTSWKITLNFRKEKVFLVISIGIVLGFSISTINIQQLANHSFPVGLIRFVDTTLMWILMVPLIRYIINSTLFIKEYSNLDLNPVLTKLGNNGFNRIVKIFIGNLILLNLFVVANIIWNLIIAKDPIYSDFIGIFLEVLIILFWAGITPLFISRAQKISKANAIMAFESHVKRTFKRFLKDPEETSSERLDWLAEQEKRIKTISTKIFSFSQWLIILITIIIAICISFIYPIIRLDYWDQALEFLNSIFK